jgi:3,4-dihydroxy 2-butanone 4-phosphate synthase/GTP cyclohydrolase II
VEHWLAVAPGPSDPFVRAIEELRRERSVVLLDLSSERAQGFVLAAAATVSATIVNDMLKHARGTPWLVLLEERCAALGLSRIGRAMRPDKLSFFTSIEARSNVTTGVSAHDRALTMRVAAGPTATRDDISTPGHVMPIGVRADGMLRRAFAVDAALTLTTWAGAGGGAAICQILDAHGEPSDAEATSAYASEHSLLLVSTIDVLDAHLSELELVRRDGAESVATAVGRVDARSYVDVLGRRHFALTWGDLRSADDPVLTAIHVQDPLRDLFDDGPDGPRARTTAAIERLAASGIGVLLSLADLGSAGTSGDTRSQLLSTKLRSYVATAILRDLGIDHVRTS